ncbi:AAA family ATPase [Plantactinospora sonchi]|uniref:AAA family ATPase n=1 Tax=Plantactinospora sonchi TaxID=1544735 RepID=A0ABU7RYA1_9ACTN
MPEGLRSALLLRTCLEVLRDVGEPTHGREVLRQVSDRVDLSPEEQAPGGSGAPRWTVHVRFLSGDAATIGWVVKQNYLWWITEAGLAALDRCATAEELHAEFRQRRAEVSRSRKQASRKFSGSLNTIVEALSGLPAGMWTSHEDLAELVGGNPEEIAHLLAKEPVPNAHRVLRATGEVPQPMHQHFKYRGADLTEKLGQEGVEFVADRAVPEQRITADILRDLTKDGASPGTRRAWLVRGSNVDGVDVVPEWLAGGWVSLAASQLPETGPEVDPQRLQQLVADSYRHKSYSVREKLVGQFNAFLRLMREGDFLLTVHRGDVHLGVVDGPPTFVASPDHRSNLRRPVRWLSTRQPIDLAQLPAPLPTLIQSQDDVVDLTDGLDALERLYAPLLAEAPPAAPAAEARLGEVTDEFAEELLTDPDWLRELRDLLAERRQVILYGPPGTGKTYLAHRLAGRLTESHAVKLIQFHPSYTYEDFFEGFRPESGEDGTLRFKLTSGPLRKLADDAREHPSTPYILIIDEINRGNLAKVFGELYFLLEYRDQRISLQYSAEDFTLPANLYLVGTMNTADRSIAPVDAAMRRRFAFVELHPSRPPVSGLLRRWLDARAYPSEAADLLDALNARLADADHAIGPSFLMRDSVYNTTHGLERVWRHDILPLLTEHHYADELDVAAHYGLDALRSAGPDPVPES